MDTRGYNWLYSGQTEAEIQALVIETIEEVRYLVPVISSINVNSKIPKSNGG